MNGYLWFYGGKRAEVYAETLLEAKTKAAAEMKVPKKKEHLMAGGPAEKDGVPVVHVADF
jgi:hypothetical protein